MEDEILDENHRSSIYGNRPLQPWPFGAGPALEVISVSIFTPIPDIPYQVYGEIKTSDYMKNEYHFFKATPDDLLEMLTTQWSDLVLTECPIAPVMGGRVLFKLYDDEDILIFDDGYDMNKAVKRADGTFFLEGDGLSGYRFKMIFTKTPFAVIVNVQMFVKLGLRDPEDEVMYYRLHGKITANKFVCFKTERKWALRLEYDRESHLSIHRHVYSVPVDSTLALDVELYHNKDLVTGTIREFEACQRSRLSEPPKLFFDSKVDVFALGVMLRWVMHEDFFAYDLESVSNSIAPMFIKPSEPKSPGALVEVFSVFSGGGKSSGSHDIDLYGAIVVCDGDEKFNILSRNKDCLGELLSTSKNDEQLKTLSLEWPDGRWVVGEKFELYLRLKDGEGNLVCVGEISWYPEVDSRYDCRLCDVFKGANGYLAAVHYSVFKNGKKAKISVECCNGYNNLVYGSIFAQYDNYDYPSMYNEQCYRSIIFKRSKEACVKVKRDSDLPLSKSQVAAPSACNELIVHVDLWVRPYMASSPYQQFKFMANTTEVKSCEMSCGRVTVKVDWVS